MTMNAIPRRSRLTARTVNRIASDLRRADGLRSTSRRMSVHKSPSTTRLVERDYSPVPCYIVEIIEEVPGDQPYIVGTRATMHDGTWGVFYDEAAPSRFLVAGLPHVGYTIDDFRQYVVLDFPVIAPTDRVCEYLHGGFFRTPEAPEAARVSSWVFVVTIDGEVIWIKDAIYQNGIWKIDVTEDARAATPAKRYTASHFRFHVAEFDAQGIVSNETLPCRLEGGFLVPEFPMLLVDPVPGEQLCEPC